MQVGVKLIVTRNGTHFAKVSDSMTAFGISYRHNVKEKRLDVIVQRFMIQEEFSQQTEVLTVLLVSLAVHFPHTYFILSVKKINYEKKYTYKFS